MKKQKKVLIIILGSYNYHIQILIENIKKVSPNLIIDIVSRQQPSIPQRILKYTDNQIEIKQSSNRISLIRYLLNKIYFYWFFFKFSRNSKYDLINIHYPEVQLLSVWNYIQKMSSKTLITPWGSDIYRISDSQLKKMKLLFDRTTYVSLPDTRFAEDVKRFFNIPIKKIKNLSMASATIDYFIDKSKSLSTADAKRNLGIKDKWVITIGYNSQRAQNHIKILEAIETVKTFLPKDMVLLFPMTYGVDKSYILEVKECVNALGFTAIFFEKFLDVHELLNLRKATDVFIHMQISDANNSSLKEYLYCDKIVINGSWLKYPQIEVYNPYNYILVDNYEQLQKQLIESYKKHEVETPLALKQDIEKTGYKYWAPLWAEFYQE